MQALITGGGGSIGGELALIYAKRGWSLVLVDISEDGMRRVAAAARDFGAACHCYRTDTSDPHQVEELQRRVSSEAGPTDLLINLAGVGVVGDFLDTPLEEWHWLMGINFWGYIHMLRAFLPAMVERGSGHVVNVASAAGLMGIPSESAYCASKFAVVGLTEALRNEMRGKGVKVTLVCPSYVRTPIIKSSHYFGYGEDYAEQMLRWAIDPARAAALIAHGIDSNGFLNIPGVVGKTGYWAKRLSLHLYLGVQHLIYRNYQRFRIPTGI